MLLKKLYGGRSEERALIASFRKGNHNRDLLLQASSGMPDHRNYLRDQIAAAFSFDDLVQREAEPLWQRRDFTSPSHGAGKAADLNSDGRDELVGGQVIGPSGRLLADSGVANRASPHIDSLAIGDIDPKRPGFGRCQHINAAGSQTQYDSLF